MAETIRIHAPKSPYSGVFAICCFLMLSGPGCSPSDDPRPDTVAAADRVEVDREYVFDATMAGYRGIEGEIEGIVNPVLTARLGERVRITIINGEFMVHDVAMERHGVASEQILEEGATTFVDFVARHDDTYFCTVPGHRFSMSGDFRIVGEERVRAFSLGTTAGLSTSI